MSYKINIFTGQLDLTGSGGGGGGGAATWKAAVADFGSLPASANTNGDVRVTLDTSNIYEWDGAEWLLIGGPGTILSIGTIDDVTPSSDGAVINDNMLILQSASNTVPGLVNNTTQTLSGVKTLAAAPILNSLIASRALVLDGSKAITTSATTAAEIAFVNGVTSSIQTQLNGKQATGNYITDLTGDVTATGPGSAVSAIGNNKVTDAMLRQSVALSVLGRSANSTGNVADITAGTDGFILRRSGTTLAFGQIVDAGVSTTAAITRSKLAIGTPNTLVVNQGTTGVMIDAAAIIANRALASDANGIPTHTSTTSTELGFVAGVTSSIQTQLNNKAGINPGDINPTAFTAADNQVAAANVTGLAFANATVRSFQSLISIARGATYEQKQINGIQKGSTWDISQTSIGDSTGLTFTITTAGQIQYTSTSTGSTAAVKFRAITTAV